MSERYHEALTDRELVNLREEIALLDSRLADLLSRVDQGEAGQIWKQVRAAFTELTIAIGTSDGERLIKSTKELEGLIGRGVSDFMAWDEITRLIDQRRKLVESERRRLVEMEQVLTLEQAQLFYRALLDSIKRNVSDRHILSAIQSDFISLTERNDSQRVITE